MPICQMKTNYKFDDAKKSAFLDEMASSLSRILEKPIPAIMVMLSSEDMYMNKSQDTVFFAEFRYVKSFESDDEKSVFLGKFADEMLTLIQKYTSVDPYRIYMQFTPMSRDGAWRYIPKK